MTNEEQSSLERSVWAAAYIWRLTNLEQLDDGRDHQAIRFRARDAAWSAVSDLRADAVSCLADARPNELWPDEIEVVESPRPEPENEGRTHVGSKAESKSQSQPEETP